MEQQTFEGTWEEILLHASEFAGKRIKLTVLSDETAEHSDLCSLTKLLEGRVGQVSFHPSDLSEHTGEAFADLLEGKPNTSGIAR